MFMADFRMENYRTKDLAEAAALIVMRRELLNMVREGKICWFIFSDKKRCEEISKQFFFDTLLVNARDFYDAMIRLKNRIFSQ